MPSCSTSSKHRIYPVSKNLDSLLWRTATISTKFINHDVANELAKALIKGKHTNKRQTHGLNNGQDWNQLEVTRKPIRKRHVLINFNSHTDDIWQLELCTL